MNIIRIIFRNLTSGSKNRAPEIELKLMPGFYKTIALIVFISCSLTYSLTAGEKNKSGRIELEVDPIAYILNGYSLHVIYVKNKIRTDLGVFGILQPEGFGGNKGFIVKTQGTGLKVNYLLNKTQTWFAGVGLGYSGNNIEVQETKESQTQKLLGVGIHVGYRWYPVRKSEKAYKNIYLAPWSSIDYNMVLNDVNFENHQYKQKPISFFPTLHIGYKI